MIKTKKARLTQVKNINELKRLGLEPDGFIRAALNSGINVIALTPVDAKENEANEADA